MSDTFKRPALFVVELTAHEVETAERALGRLLYAVRKPEPKIAAARPATRRGSRPTSLPWRPSGPALQPGYSHTTPELDAWLERRATPGFTPRPIATPSLGKPKRATPQQVAREESAWRDYAETGRSDGNAYPVTTYLDAFARQVALLDALAAGGTR